MPELTKKLIASPYNSRLQKGGALLEDMRTLVRQWPPPEESASGVAAFVHSAMAKQTSARSWDTFKRAFRPRFLDGDPIQSWKIVRPIEDRGWNADQVRPLYYWIAARSDRLLYEYVTGFLAGQAGGFPRVDSEHTARWITSTIRPTGLVWTETVTLKVARGLLAALRDFALLEGANKKRLVRIHLSLPTFSYLAFALHRLGASGTSLVDHPDWGLFLLTTRQQREQLFMEANQARLMHYQAAGSLVRVEFPSDSFEEYAHVVTERTHRPA
jgi:hypothetical protein